MRGLLVSLVAYAAGTAAFKITFQNKCDFDIWPAVGIAPSGRPDNSFSWGAKASPGESVSTNVGDKLLGVRAWGRTGCDSNGANCKTGGCNGGLICNDAGITSGVILSEYGYADFGAQWGGERISWDLSRVDLVVNIDTQLVAGDGQKVICTKNNCPSDQAYFLWDDYVADRNSDPGTGFTHVFCPNGKGSSNPAFPGTKSETKPTSAVETPEKPATTPTPSAPAETPATTTPSSTPRASSSSSSTRPSAATNDAPSPTPASVTPSGTPATPATPGKKCPHLSARRMSSLTRRQLYLASLTA